VWLFFAGLFAGCAPVGVHPEPAATEHPGVGHQLASDSKYLANQTEADLEDIVTAPLHIGEVGSLFRKPETYYILLGTAVALGTAFALDQTVRARVRNIGNDDALNLESGGTALTAAGAAALYGYGLYDDDYKAREYAITGGVSAGLASAATLALKYGLARARPEAGKGAFAFFDHGQSFVSGEATPAFALAAATSEYFDNDLRAAIPLYSGAVAVGIGRMGHDAHWLSDIVGSAVVGVGTTELLLYLHALHDQNPSRFRVFPAVGTGSAEVEITYVW